MEVQQQDRNQHQHAADQRVQKELDRRVFASRPAPDADQEVHRQQHHFPEHIEQEEVERQEDAQHAGFQQQEQYAVGLHVLGHRPTGTHRQQADQCGEHDQRQADPVDSHEVVDVERRNPGNVKGVLHRPDCRIEPRFPHDEKGEHAERQHHGAGGQGDVSLQFMAVRRYEQRHDKRHGSGQEHDQTQQSNVRHRLPSQCRVPETDENK